MTKAAVKTKSKAAAAVPQTRGAVAEAIAAIGMSQRELTRIEATMGDEIAAIKANYEAYAEPHKAAVQALTAGVQTWCEAHRAELTGDGKAKTAQFTTGEVRWRLPPPSVKLTGVEALLARLKKLGLTRFVRIKEEVNKEAILAEPEAVRGVAGITLQQAEEFVVVPHETVLEGAP